MLLTRPPLDLFPKELLSLDLHVLGTPPAFVLSQDQTLRLILESLSLELLKVILFIPYALYSIDMVRAAVSDLVVPRIGDRR